MKWRCLMVLVDPNQDTQTAHWDLIFHAEELEFIPVVSALERQQILGYIHQRVVFESRPLLVQLGMGLAQRSITGQTVDASVSQTAWIQVRQKSCPHWSVTGSVKKSWQTGHFKASPTVPMVLLSPVMADFCAQRS
ncbi:hypothetical protein XENOCAPTIV_029409 [Xenoophorus captivus]|uniref:Uncharacterized protein n=1 Tax=Xenoophorus captivus TaxID=1517983 RepID=A0ABV0SEE7_9TELE